MPKRVSTGIVELDKALEGGVPKGSWVVLAGEPGTGKTILCLHFAYAGLQAGEPVIYVTTEQEFGDVLEQARTLGLDFSKYPRFAYLPDKQPEAKPQLIIIDLFSLWKKALQLTEKERSQQGSDEQKRIKRYAALDIVTLQNAIQDAISIVGKQKHVRSIIDSISAFWVDKPAMARKMSYELKLKLHRPYITAYLTSQYATSTGATFGFGVEHIADGVLHLWMDNVEKYKEVRRYMIIKKMRMTNHAKHAFKLDILPGKGVVLEPVRKS